MKHMLKLILGVLTLAAVTFGQAQQRFIRAGLEGEGSSSTDTRFGTHALSRVEVIG
jgi:hypothetical protein